MKKHIEDIISVATTLGITVPPRPRMDQVMLKDLMAAIRTKLTTYDPTAPSTGNAVAADVTKNKTFSNAVGVGLTGTFDFADETAGDATAADIADGKEAWVDGVKVVGTFDFAVETAGDAVASDILFGKTAWVDGVAVEGTFDFADETAGDATAADILAGKTAWVDGVEVTGTYEPIVCSVTRTLTNLTDSASVAYIVSRYEALTGQLSLSGVGVALPATITVTVGGDAIEQGTDFTYDSATGAYSIPAALLDGDVVITAAAATE